MTHTNQDVSTDDIFAVLSGDLKVDDIFKRRAARASRKALGRIQNEIEHRLQTYSTRELVDFLESRRAGGDIHWVVTDILSRHGRTRDDRNNAFDPVWWALRKVLATRPHVMNKFEARKARKKRQKMARKFHGQGKGRDR